MARKKVSFVRDKTIISVGPTMVDLTYDGQKWPRTRLWVIRAEQFEELRLQNPHVEFIEIPPGPEK